MTLPLFATLALWLGVAAADVEDAPHATQYAPATLDGQPAQIAYWEVGPADAPVVMLVHGLPTSKELWVHVVPALRERFRVVVPDLPDFGETQVDGAISDHAFRADGLDQLRAHLGVQTFALVAHDLGASVAVEYMGTYGAHVDKLVLLSSPVYPDFDEPFTVNLIRKPWIGVPLTNLVPRLLYRRAVKKGLVHNAALDRFQKRAFMSAYRGPAGKRRLRQNLWWGTPEEMFADYPAIMQQIAVPTLLIHGAHDPYIPLEHAQRMDRDIADSTLAVVEDGAHFLPIDTPEAVGALLAGFL